MDLAAYLSFCFVMSFTPGPNNLMSLAQSRERTFRGALPFLLGLHVSLFSMCTVIYLFIHALEDILPLIMVGTSPAHLGSSLSCVSDGAPFHEKRKEKDKDHRFQTALFLRLAPELDQCQSRSLYDGGLYVFSASRWRRPCLDLSSRHGHEPYVQCRQFYLGPRRLPLGSLFQGSRKACFFDDCVLASLFCRKDPFPQSLLGLGTFVNGCKTSAEDPSG